MKRDDFFLFRLVDRNGRPVLCISSYLPESLLSEEVWINEKTKTVRFVDRAAINGQLETGKEMERHLRKKTERERLTPAAWFLIILATAIIRCI